MSCVLVMLWISRGCVVAAEELLLSVCNHHSLVLVNPLVPAVGSASLCVTWFMSPVLGEQVTSPQHHTGNVSLGKGQSLGL